MLTAPEAMEAMREFLNERITNLALGLTIARHFLKLDALTEISEQQIDATVLPWLTTALGGSERTTPT
jgi:hypothetical protein